MNEDVETGFSVTLQGWPLLSQVLFTEHTYYTDHGKCKFVFLNGEIPCGFAALGV